MKSSQSSGASETPLAKGDWVRVQGMPGVGCVASIDSRRKRARVDVNGQEWVVALEKLTRSATAPDPPRQDPPVRISGGGPVYYEIDLHGLYVEEALDLARRGLDQAIVNHLDRFKIIHGHGSGRVRQAVRKMLSEHPHVRNYRFGEPQEGGLACTIALFRDDR